MVSLSIHEGQFEAFEAIAQSMIDGTKQEAGALAYEFCLSANRKHCRLIEIYVNAESVAAHLAGPVVQQLVPKILTTANLTGFEVYGDPGSKSAEILAGMGAQIFGTWRGFSR
jgi:quinol monooxygenase YgiN